MAKNRIFICHAIHNEKSEEAQILQYVIEALEKAGFEIITQKNDGTEESFFQHLGVELPTCQSFLLLHTSNAIYASKVIFAVRTAKTLFNQKGLPGIFRFICPSVTEDVLPLEWKSIIAFDGTHDYQLACAKLVATLVAEAKKSTGIVEQTNVVGNSIPLVPLDVIPTSAMPALGRVSVPESPAQTAFTHSPYGATPLEIVTTSTPPPAFPGNIPGGPSHPNSSRSLQMAPTGAIPVLRRPSSPPKPVRTNYDRPPKLSIWKRLAEQRKLLAGIAIALVVLILLGSAGVFFFLNVPTRTSLASAPNLITGSSNPTIVPSPTPEPTLGQVTFFGSDQIGVNNNTGVADQIQVNLQNITPPAAGNAYYAWLLPNPRNSDTGKTLSVGPLTVNNGVVTLTFANPTHENLLLTQNTFLITEESANPASHIPSPDQRLWRYIGSIPQTPNPQDPAHLSKLDHIRRLLVVDPDLQALKLQGGSSTWFYLNVQKVFELTNATNGLVQQQSWYLARNNLIRILDYLDGANNVATDVPKGTVFLVQPPETAQIPLLTLDPVNQNPRGFIDHLETDLLGLTSSPDATDVDRTIASQVHDELGRITTHLVKVHDDAKQLVNLSFAQLADPKNAPIFTDMMDSANAAFVGELDPTNNARQGGATFVHDVLPRFASIDVKAFKIS